MQYLPSFQFRFVPEIVSHSITKCHIFSTRLNLVLSKMIDFIEQSNFFLVDFSF